MIEFIRARRQTIWGWPAVLNFALGGAGAASFLLAELFRRAGSPIGSAIWTGLAGPFLVAIGFLALTREAGRPFRARFALGNLRRSWMSRETLAAAIFIPSAVLSVFDASGVMGGCAAVAAGAFILTQGAILDEARAVPAWNQPCLPWIFLASALEGGAGVLWMLPAAPGSASPGFGFAVTALMILGWNRILWHHYLRGRGTEAMRCVAREQRQQPRWVGRTIRCRTMAMWLVIVVCLFPILSPASLSGIGPLLHFAAGFSLLLASFAQKAAIVRECGYLRAVTGLASTGFPRVFVSTYAAPAASSHRGLPDRAGSCVNPALDSVAAQPAPEESAGCRP